MKKKLKELSIALEKIKISDQLDDVIEKAINRQSDERVINMEKKCIRKY